MAQTSGAAEHLDYAATQLCVRRGSFADLGGAVGRFLYWFCHANYLHTYCQQVFKSFPQQLTLAYRGVSHHV